MHEKKTKSNFEIKNFELKEWLNNPNSSNAFIENENSIDEFKKTNKFDAQKSKIHRSKFIKDLINFSKCDEKFQILHLNINSIQNN